MSRNWQCVDEPSICVVTQVVVAVIDTGIDYTHPDLKVGAIFLGLSFV